MTTSYGMAVGRRPGPAAVLAMALSLGACEALSGQEASVLEEASAVSADAADLRLADRRGLPRAPAGVDAADDSAVRSAGPPRTTTQPRALKERQGRLPTRIMVVRAPGVSSASSAEVQERLRKAIESGDDAGVIRLGDSEGQTESLPPGLVDRVLRAAAATGGTSELPSAAPDVARAAAAALSILDQGGVHEKTVDAAEFLVDHAAVAPGGADYASEGAKALLEFAPAYEGMAAHAAAAQQRREIGVPDRKRGRGESRLRGVGFRGRGSGVASRGAVLPGG